jgi:predicted adenylyl cyclase CyaB
MRGSRASRKSCRRSSSIVPLRAASGARPGVRGVARNIEIKARVADLAAVEARARPIATSGPQEIFQDDTFFRCRRGRLKLRDFGDGTGQIIHYSRADDAGPKVSDYVIAPTADPHALREALSRAHGIEGRVVKRRRLYLAGRTRIHLDRVEGLGDFAELEVVLGDGDAIEAGDAEARSIMQALGIGEADLVTGAYLDLLKG